MDNENKIVEKYLNGGNVNIRVGHIFKDKLEYIDNKRKELGLSKLSHPKKTELLQRHEGWFKIEEDIINFHAGGEKK